MLHASPRRAAGADTGGIPVEPATYGTASVVAADLTELFRGLPDDRCQCPHWGVVLKGQLKFTGDDGDTIIGPGEAYYVGPGHLPYLYAGTEVIEFSPPHELHETLAVIEKNVAARSG